MDIAVTDWVGIVGSALIVIAYFLNQRGQPHSTDWRFPGLNLVGALLILFSLWFAWNLPSVLIEAFWVAISLYGLARPLRCEEKWQIWARAPRSCTAAVNLI